MRFLSLFIAVFFSSIFLLAHEPNFKLIENDIQNLFKQSQILNARVHISWSEDSSKIANNQVRFICKKDNYEIQVQAIKTEWISTAYYAVRKLGFLFPHPRMQITPSASSVLKLCGQSWKWQPILQQRGFHLHTQHAGEWTDAFFMGQSLIAKDTLWWLARNQQNLVQLQTLRIPDSELQQKLNPLIDFSHSLGIQFGLSFSFAMVQQKNYYLIPFWRAITGIGADDALRKKIKQLIRDLDFDYATSEVGTTEFTSINEDNTLKWMQIVQEELTNANRSYFIKSHVSSNQHSIKYGNFNFLPQFAAAPVGVQAHTVFFYGLRDEHTPMYGRKNFVDMTEFMLSQQNKRTVWYFPETSYYIGMDIDIPLLLTDYLVARADDMKFLNEHHFTGQVNFSTGQELGYWLFDWSLALLNDTDLKQNPLAGFQLLGEDQKTWTSILQWQTEYIKKQQLIQALSSANLMDDLFPLMEKTHERFLLRELKNNKTELLSQITRLRAALDHQPDLSKVKNTELKLMLEVTLLRFQHALKLREALSAENPKENLDECVAIRKNALDKMQQIKTNYNRYPESFVFSEKENPSSYPYGYGWPAVTLHFWEREEKIVRYHQYWNPFFMSIYNPVRILF